MIDLVRGPDGVTRCGWSMADAAYVAYHDREWGRPVTDEQRLFEKLCLEGFQAGLSWLTILRKRPAFRDAFAGFDPHIVADFDDADVERLVRDARIVRHRGKIEATIANARAVRALHAAGQTLSNLVWSYAPTAGRNADARRSGSQPDSGGRDDALPRALADLPAQTPESIALSKSLRSHGFRFVGPTTVYAFMQAMGLVNDHLLGCDVGDALRGGAVQRDPAAPL